MIKLFFLIVFLFTGPYLLRADQPPLVGGQGSQGKLDNVKDPFGDIPPPVVPVAVKPVEEAPKPVVVEPKPQPVAPPAIVMPSLQLQGIIMGADMREAIINDQIVPVHGRVQGAEVVSVTKQGVRLIFRGKKFFLKVD